MDRKELIEQNLGLVHACANRFRGRGIEYEELYSAGCLGLVKAADGFREELGFAFSTYAVPAVLGEIRRLFRDGGAVKVSRSLKERSREAVKLSEKLTKENGRAYRNRIIKNSGDRLLCRIGTFKYFLAARVAHCVGR